MTIAVIIAVALPVALVLGGRWIVDADTRRRDHAAYRARCAAEWRDRYGGRP